MTMQAKIEERGNGLPDAGDYVTDAKGELYCVTSISNNIHTHTDGMGGNWVYAEVEEADWSEIEGKEPHSAKAHAMDEEHYDGDDGADLDEDRVYTYTIFDANPNTSSGTAWPTHTSEELEAASDEEAIAEVRRIMRSEAKGLSPDDGYSVGDYLYALIWSADGTQLRQVTHELTADDLGEYIAYEREES